MANNSGRKDNESLSGAAGHPAQNPDNSSETARRNGQLFGGDKDARGMTRDSARKDGDGRISKGGNAKDGPWAVHPEPKGD